MTDAIPNALFRPRRNPVVRFLSSIWLGITLLALILAYSSVISAYAPARWALEMTEMQAFRHWFFVALCLLFVIALVAATLARMRWTAFNVGAVTAHFGLLLLIAGAFAYFGTKIEGDVLLQSPAILVRSNVPGGGILARFRAGVDSSWSRMLPQVGPVTLRVLAAEARGAQAVAAVHMSVQVGDQEPRLVHLSDRPEDWQPVNELLSVRLETFPPQTGFYDSDTPVLHVRGPGKEHDTVRRIDHLPIYRERYLPEGPVLKDAQGHEFPSRRTTPELRLGGLRIPTGWLEPWRMPIEVDSADLPFTIQVTGYAPHVVSFQPATGPDGKTIEVPVLETRENRRPDIAPRSASAIRLRLTGRGEHAGWSETRWCPYSSYPEADARSIQVRIPGTPGAWEFKYTRARLALGAAISAEKLYVEYFPGQRGVESFYSDVLVQPDGGTPFRSTVSTNRTLTIGHWTLFQSGFDGENRWSYSILGVGNRLGLWTMNVGWIVVALGCLYAFYVKPVLLRRRTTETLRRRVAEEYSSGSKT